MTYRGKSYARIVAACATWCMKRPSIVFPIASVVLGLSAFGVTKAAIDPSPETFLLGSDLWAAYERVDNEYDISETVVIAFRELGGTVFDVETVTALAQFDRGLSDMPGVERVLSIASATALDRDNDVLDLTPLLPSGPITQETAIKLATRIRKHPVYGQALVDAPHETTYVFVQMSNEVKDPVLRLETVRSIRELADTFRTKSRTVHLAGSAVMKEAIATAIARDTLIYLPAALIVLVLLLWLVFGELVAAIVPLSVVCLASISTLGLFAAIHVPLNLTTAIVPILILVIGLAESVHFLSELRRQHTRTNDRDVSLAATVEALSMPSLIACLAAGIAFVSLAPSSVGPLRELGLSAAMGLFVVYCATMLLTPTLLRAFRFPRGRSRPFASAPWIGRVLSRFALAARKKMIITLAAIGLLSGMAIAATTTLQVEQDFVGYLPDDHRLKSDMSIIERTLGGVETIELILDGDREGFFKSTTELARLEKLGKLLEGKDGVHTAFSLADYLKIANGVMMGGRDAEARLPESEEAVAQLMVIDPTPFSAFADAEMKQARLALQVRSMSARGTLALVERLKQKAERALEGSGIKVSVTGRPVLYAQLVDYVVADALRRFAIAAFFVWVVLILGLRSVAIACVAMLPMALTMVFTLGTMALFNLPLDTVIIFIAALVLGLGVNHSVHLSERYQRAREEGSPTPEAAVLYASTHGGHPVFVNCLLVLIGFSVISVSSFLPTVYAGLLGAILGVFLLLFDLFYLPVMLMLADWLENRHSYSVPSLVPASHSFIHVVRPEEAPTPVETPIDDR